MSVDNAIILLTIVTILFSLNVRNTFAGCVSDSPCTCVMSNGQGYDLSKITGPKDEFVESTRISNRTFYFHPCNDKKFSLNIPNINTTGCDSTTGISLCLYDATSNQSTNLGSAKESKLLLQLPDIPQIIVNHANGSKQSIVTIDLICNYRTDVQTILLEYNTPATATNYNLALVSPHACKKPMHLSGLSTGSVLVIIFFIFSGIYFAGGALTLKLLRGATGWEMLPNQKFWFDVPALVRDGVAFTFNGCKVVSYDQI